MRDFGLPAPFGPINRAASGPMASRPATRQCEARVAERELVRPHRRNSGQNANIPPLFRWVKFPENRENNREFEKIR